MKKKRLTKSVRKFIRFEKARIRREISDSKKQEELIQQLYERFNSKPIDQSVSIKRTQKLVLDPKNVL